MENITPKKRGRPAKPKEEVTEKKPKGRPATGRKTRREYYEQEKQNRYIMCEACNKQVSKYALKKHIETNIHNANLRAQQ